MGELWALLKPIVEAGVLGALLILAVRLWISANKEVRQEMENRVLSEKEHSKELMRLQAVHAKELTDLLRQYDGTLIAVNSTLERLIPEE